MPRIDARMYVNVRLRTTEHGAGTVLTRVLVRPGGSNALELLRNGGGKSTLTALQLFALVSRLNDARKRMYAYFRPDQGPSYVAFDLRQTSPSIAVGHEHTYLVCRFDCQGSGEDSTVRRHWAVLPGSSAGRFDALPLTNVQDGRIAPTPGDEFDRWARKLPGAKVIGEGAGLREVEDALLEASISPSELACQLRVNHDEGGIERFFGSGRTSESFFDKCLMPVVQDSVWPSEGGEWLVSNALELSRVARERRSELTKLDAAGEYHAALEGARKALADDMSARRSLTELRDAALRARLWSQRRKAELASERDALESEASSLESRYRELEYMRLSSSYHRKKAEQEECEREAAAALERLSVVKGDHARANEDLLRFKVAGAWVAWHPVDMEWRESAARLQTLEGEDEELGATLIATKAMLLHALGERVEHAEAEWRHAKVRLGEAESRMRSAKKHMSVADSEVRDANKELGGREALSGEAERRLKEELSREPALAECTRVASTLDLLGHRSSRDVEELVQTAAASLAKATEGHAAARDRSSEAEAAVESGRRDHEGAKERVHEARRLLAEAKSQLDAATSAHDGLEASIGSVLDMTISCRDLNEVGRALDALLPKLRQERRRLERSRDLVGGQLDALEGGRGRVDRRVSDLCERLGIEFRTVGDLLGESGNDPSLYLGDCPWLADVLFVSDEDVDALRQGLSDMPDAGNILQLVSTTESLDSLIEGVGGGLHALNNSVIDWVIDPAAGMAWLRERITEIDNKLNAISTREDAREDALARLAACRQSLGDYASLGELEAHELELEEGLSVAERESHEAQTRLRTLEDEARSCREAQEQAASALQNAERAHEKCAAVAKAIRECDAAIDSLGEAKAAVAGAEGRLERSRREHDAARDLLAQERRAEADLRGQLDSAKELLREHDAPGVDPAPDPEGRDAEELIAVYEATERRVGAGHEELKEAIAAAKTEKERLGYKRDTLENGLRAACRAAGLDVGEAEAVSVGYDASRESELEERVSALSDRMGEAEHERERSRSHADAAGGAVKAARQSLSDFGYAEPMAPEACLDVDVAAERRRVEAELDKKRGLISANEKESRDMDALAADARGVETEADRAGAFAERPEDSMASLDARTEVDAAMESLGQAIENRKATMSEAAEAVSALRGVRGLEEALAGTASANADTLSRALGADSPAQTSGALKSLEDAIGSCGALIELLKNQLEQYEQRLDETVGHCARDVAGAAVKVADVVRDARVNVSPRGEGRKMANFLYVSVGGKRVDELARSRSREDLVEDSKRVLGPYLKNYVEETLASITDDNDARKRAKDDLTLSRLLRVSLGEGTPGAVEVRHDTYTKRELRRRIRWESLFGRTAEAQSGAETTLVFFAVYFAITKAMRETEIVRGDSDDRFVILDNPFTKMSDRWAVSFLGTLADHFGCQMLVMTALNQIAESDVFPFVCSYQETRGTADGTHIIRR